MNKTCIVIPVYNHEGAMPGVMRALMPYGLHCIMVDDGSSEACRATLQALAAEHASWASLIRLEPNQGKGGAVMAGLGEAYARGFSHALQIDADGQHQSGDLPLFLAASLEDPRAVVCGVPVFDGTAPAARLYGRLATQIWIWINTLSTDIKDAMCGFRLYPLEPLHCLMREARLGLRMDFDPEVLVRLHWKGLRFVGIPTRVRYPADGRSHFRLWGDNWLISCMHARLFFGMLARLPLLLWNKWQAARKVQAGQERQNSVLPGA